MNDTLKPNRPLRGAVYARTSKEDRARSTEQRCKISIEQQIESGVALAIKKGAPPSDIVVIEDRDRESWLPPRQWAKPGERVREGFGDLIDLIEKDELDFVIVRKTDRLARKAKFAHLLWDLLKEHGVRLYCTDEVLPQSD